MSRKQLIRMMLGTLLLLALPLASVSAQDDSDDNDDGEMGSSYHLRGTDIVQIGEYPDTMAYDGQNVVDIERPGFFEIHVDAENNVGLMFPGQFNG